MIEARVEQRAADTTALGLGGDRQRLDVRMRFPGEVVDLRRDEDHPGALTGRLLGDQHQRVLARLVQRVEQVAMVADVDLVGGAPRRPREVGEARRERPQQRLVGGDRRPYDHPRPSPGLGGEAVEQRVEAVVLAAPLEAHAEPLQHPRRGAIGHVGQRHHFGVPQGAEHVVDDGRRAFGGEALAPPLAAQPVEQFWLAAVAHAAPAKAHQRAAGRLVDAPQPDAAVGEAAVALGQRFGGALARDLLAVPEVPTHVGIGPQRVRDVEVGGGERPQPRAGGGEDRHGDQRPETGGAVTRQAAKKSTPRSASIPATAVVAAATRPETNSRNVGMANAAFSSTAIGISAR